MQSFKEWCSHPRRKKALQVRKVVERAIRSHFDSLGFEEVRTPLLVRSPGMEAHLPVFRLENGAFLPTSPEFAMKKLLVGGMKRIYQLAPSFRAEPLSPQHHPEFLMLEWYRADSSLESIYRDCETLLAHLAEKTAWTDSRIDLKSPFPRFRTEELFLSEGISLVTGNSWASTHELAKICSEHGIPASEAETWDDLYFKLWLNVVEPKLPMNRPVFVTHYPESQSALAELENDPRGIRWAKRFELYIAGVEIANAFQELTDAREQRERFEKECALRLERYGEQRPIDEEFLSALEEGLPQSAGIALGVDRLVQLFANEPDLLFTLALPSFVPSIEDSKDGNRARDF